MSQIEGDEEIKKRQLLVEKFYKLVLKEDEYPEGVDDFDRGYNVCYKIYNKIGDEKAEEYLTEKISKAYGVHFHKDYLDEDFWILLDYLEQEQQRQKTQKLLPKPD